MPEADYNVAPRTFQPVIRASKETGEREPVAIRWACCRTLPRASHMFDFDHIGSEQVITLENGRGFGPGGTQTLRVYGNANAVPHAVKRDAEYRRTIANHTHY